MRLLNQCSASCYIILTALWLGITTLPLQGQPQPNLTQRSELDLVIGDRIGARPRFAVPNCLALTGDTQTEDAATTIASVLWSDLAFEREFLMVARDTTATIPASRTLTDIPFDAWRELGADGVVSCSVSRVSEDELRVQARLFNIRSLESAFGVEYSGSLQNVRLYGHQLADEIHRHQTGLNGIARSHLSFISDRDSQSALGLVPDRQTKEVYVADYDGANIRRVTVTRTLNITPNLSPAGRSLAYTSYRSGFPDVVISHIYEGRMDTPAGGTERVHNWLPSFSPDGTQLAFNSNRDGNIDIYIMNVDGTAARRLTNHPGIDTSPTWSPLGHQIAFTSDRSGSPQIYAVDIDGTGLRRITFESYCDRPTWSPAPYNEIAYASRTGPGFDIKVVDLATNEVRQLTFGQGSNESPSYSPNGRHLAFSSSRGNGDKQIYLIGRDGRGLKKLTSRGNNEMPSWSR